MSACIHTPAAKDSSVADGDGEVGANRNAVNARAGGRAGPRQRMPNIWEGGISEDVVGSRLVGCSIGGGTRLLEAKPFLRAQSIRSDVSPHLPVPYATKLWIN